MYASEGSGSMFEVASPMTRTGSATISPRQRTRRADVEQNFPVSHRLAKLDKRAERPEKEQRHRDEIGQRHVDVVTARREEMSQFVRAKDQQQAQRVGQPLPQADLGPVVDPGLLHRADVEQAEKRQKDQHGVRPPGARVRADAPLYAQDDMLPLVIGHQQRVIVLRGEGGGHASTARFVSGA